MNMFSFEVNILCDGLGGEDCQHRGILTGEPAPIEGAIESALQEAMANNWSITICRDGKILAMCPECQQDRVLEKG